MTHFDSAGNLPGTCLVRIHEILGCPNRGIRGLLPMGRTAWYKGIREGRYPAGVLLGPRMRAWKIEEIRTVMAGNGAGGK